MYTTVVETSFLGGSAYDDAGVNDKDGDGIGKDGSGSGGGFDGEPGKGL